MKFIAIATLLSTLALSAAASAAFNKVMIVDVGGKSTKAIVGTQQGDQLVLKTAKYSKGLDGAPSTAMNSANAYEILDHFAASPGFEGIDRVLVYGTAGWRKLANANPGEIENIKEAIRNYYIDKKASVEAKVIPAATEAEWAYESVKTAYPEYNTKELTFMEIGSTSAQFVYNSESGDQVLRLVDLGQQEYLSKLYEKLGPNSQEFNKCFGPHALASHSKRAHRDMIGEDKIAWILPETSEQSGITHSTACPKLLRKHFGPGDGNKCGLNGVEMECVNPHSDVFVTSLHTFQRIFKKNELTMSDIRNTVKTVCDGMKDRKQESTIGEEMKDGEQEATIGEEMKDVEQEARSALKSLHNLKDEKKFEENFQWIRGRAMFCADVSMHLTVLESIGVQDDQKLLHYPELMYGKDEKDEKAIPLPSSWVLKPLKDELEKPNEADDNENF